MCIFPVCISSGKLADPMTTGVQSQPWTVGTIDIDTNPSEPTSECGLGNRENPSEPTTPLPSPQKWKTEASEINDIFWWFNFFDFSLGTTRYDSLDNSDFGSGATRYDWSKFSDVSSGATRYRKSEKLSQQKSKKNLLNCDFLYCGLWRGVVGSKGFWFTCGLGRICS